MDTIFCVQCESYRLASEFNRKGEHILPFGFGNDGSTNATLIDQICLSCNQNYGNIIDKPFIRHVASREIEKIHGMKRRHTEAQLKVTGSGAIVRYETTTTHLFECLKIAFETHIKFLRDEYRDDTFHSLRKLLLGIMIEYNNLQQVLKDQKPHGRKIDEVWADTGQGIVTSKYFNIISQNVYRLDDVSNNSAEIISVLKSRSGIGDYSSLIQLSCWDFGVAVMICLQSLPPLVVRVCNQIDRYVEDFGRECSHVMDLRSSEKWVGRENSASDEMLTF